MKLGQVLSTRGDLLPAEFIEELSTLQDKVPPFGMEDVRKQVQAAFGRPAEELFRDFDETPIAAASMAQVHKATTHDGVGVVVKVQRPGITERMRGSPALHGIARALEAVIEEVSITSPTTIIEEFDKAVHEELDFLNEASNVRAFMRAHENHLTVRIPKVYDELTGRTVLTLEFLDGPKLSKPCNWQRGWARRSANIILEGVYSFFQNWVFDRPPAAVTLPRGAGARADRLRARRAGDPPDAGGADSPSHPRDRAEGLGVGGAPALSTRHTRQPREPAHLQDRHRRDLERVPADLDQGREREGARARPAEPGREVPGQGAARVRDSRESARWPSKASCARCTPRCPSARSSMPYARKMMAERYDPSQLQGNAMKTLLRLQSAASDLPLQLQQIMLDLESGKFTITLKDDQVESLNSNLRALAVVAFAGLCACGFIIGTFLAFAPKQLQIAGIPVMGVLGIGATVFLFSTAMVRQVLGSFRKVSIKRFLGKR